MIRVLRLLEYAFPDYETCNHDMAHWAVPAHGARTFGSKQISSATLVGQVVPPMTADEAANELTVILDRLALDGWSIDVDDYETAHLRRDDQQRDVHLRRDGRT